jgi:CubicO group peptidase (beta-lactamase class C family)
MKKVMLPAFLLLVLFGENSYGQDIDKRFTGLDEQLERIRNEFNVPGFSVAVVEKNKIVYIRGFGFRDLENKIPVTPNTLFIIGSCSKAFTAATIGQLEDQKKFQYDDAAHKVLPSLSFYNDELNNKITIRDMLSHRTGLLRYDRSWVLFNKGPRDSILHRVPYIEPMAPLRDKFIYSSMMYITLAVIAEKLSGQSWENLVTDKVLRPLKMESSSASMQAWKNSPDKAYGYRIGQQGNNKLVPYYVDLSLSAPAGGIISNANDMSNWLMAWLNGGRRDSVQVLPASFVKEALTAQILVLPSLPNSTKPDIHFSGYGFGWALSSYRSHYKADHGGRVEGFTSQTVLYPTDSIGIVIMANQTSSNLPGAVANVISDKIFGLPPYNWVAEMKQANTNFIAGRSSKKTALPYLPPSHKMYQYTGDYFHGAFGHIHVTASSDSLFASAGDYTFWMKHLSQDHFELFLTEPGKNNIDTSEYRPGKNQVQFHFDNTSVAESLDIDFEPSVKPIVFTRQRQIKK